MGKDYLLLSELKPGEEGVVLGFLSQHPKCRQKLLAMGLLPHTPFKLLRRAPLGDPLLIEVRNFCLSLRAAEARAIKVERLVSATYIPKPTNVASVILKNHLVKKEKASKDIVTVALAGNPNAGKTVIFNALTGSQQRVGNWPGVTVEKKSGHYHFQNKTWQVVDLPGIYSLSQADAIDEKISWDYLLSGEVDVIVNVIDASNLERNLYLTLQLLEMEIPVILAVNMLDIVEKRGVALDMQRLSILLNCPVVGLVANQGKGFLELKNKIKEVIVKPGAAAIQTPFPQKIESLIAASPHPRWQTLAWLENNATAAISKEIQQELGEEADILIADARYSFAHQLTQKISQKANTSTSVSRTQKLDRLVLNRFLGIPIFLLVMYGLFLFAINIAGAFQEFFDMASDALLVKGSAQLLTSWHLPPWLIAIIANGLGKGINTTITFIPVIGGMFLCLAFLEDCGYMARAAVVMDRLMQSLGLPGKSFIPMIVGFGCNVPAVMGARTLSNPYDRILTVMMMPFMSCGARLAIFAIFAAAFFPQHGGAVIFMLYLTGIVAAILTGLLLRKTVLQGQSSPLIM